MIEAMAERQSGDAIPSDRERRRRRIVRGLAWMGGSIVLILVVGVAVAGYVHHNAEPILRKRVIASLQARFHSSVELDTLHISLVHGL